MASLPRHVFLACVLVAHGVGAASGTYYGRHIASAVAASRNFDIAAILNFAHRSSPRRRLTMGNRTEAAVNAEDTSIALPSDADADENAVDTASLLTGLVLSATAAAACSLLGAIVLVVLVVAHRDAAMVKPAPRGEAPLAVLDV